MFEELEVKHHYISGLYGTEYIVFPFDFDKSPKMTLISDRIVMLTNNGMARLQQLQQGQKDHIRVFILLCGLFNILLI